MVINMEPNTVTQIKMAINKRMSLRPNSVKSYAEVVAKFCAENEIGTDWTEIGLAKIEELTEEYIMKHTRAWYDEDGKQQEPYAPKYLNLILNGVKTWCYVQRLIKSRKTFAEIKFDKSSRKTDAVTERALEPEHLKQMMQISNAHQKVTLALYGIAGLRPLLQPQLTVAQIHPDHYTLKNGKLQFTVKNPFVFIPKEWQGNKANITFFIILHSQLTELIEYTVNTDNPTVTPTTPLIGLYQSDQTIYKAIKAIFTRVGFNGRPYLLRVFADRTLDKTIMDEDLKEHMLGHKGKISAIYQFKQLTAEDIRDYTQQYQKVEQWVNEHVFGTVSSEQLTAAKQMATMAQGLGFNQTEIEAMLTALQKGKMTFTSYQNALTEGIKKAQEKKLETNFNTMFEAAMKQREKAK